MTRRHTARPAFGSSPDSWKLARLFAARNSVVVSPAVARGVDRGLQVQLAAGLIGDRQRGAVEVFGPRDLDAGRARQFQARRGLVDAALDVGVDEDRDAAVLDAQPDRDLALPGRRTSSRPASARSAARRRRRPSTRRGHAAGTTTACAVRLSGLIRSRVRTMRVPVVGVFQRVRGTQPQLVGLRSGGALAPRRPGGWPARRDGWSPPQRATRPRTPASGSPASSKWRAASPSSSTPRAMRACRARFSSSDSCVDRAPRRAAHGAPAPRPAPGRRGRLRAGS